MSLEIKTLKDLKELQYYFPYTQPENQPIYQKWVSLDSLKKTIRTEIATDVHRATLSSDEKDIELIKTSSFYSGENSLAFRLLKKLGGNE